MGRVGVAVRPAPGLPLFGSSLRALLLTAGLAAFTSLFVVAANPLVRLPVAAVIGAALVVLTLVRPAAGVLATASYLVFMALIRRLLIPESGWWPVDPLLLVGPLVAGVLIVKLFLFDRRPLAPDPLSKMVLVLLLVSVVEIANPAGGGIAKGSVGLLYVTVPLLWFFIGRELLSEAVTRRLLRLLLALAVVVAAYGLVQSELGHPVWDLAWVEVSGYDALNVGTELRPFGTFSSSAEYALFLGAGLVVAVAFVLRGYAFALLSIPLLGLALFLASGRGALVTAVFAAFVVVGLRPGRPLTAAAVFLAAAALAFGAVKLVGSELSSGAGSSTNDLVSHQLGGITDPLNPDSSTLLVHVEKMWQGIEWSLHHPLGQGTASTTIAGESRGSGELASGSTEVDISNSFVSFGPAGGLLYVAIILLTLFQALRSHFGGREMALPVIGVLIVGLGQWLTGGNYALATIIWLLVGAVAAMSLSRRSPSVAPAAAPSGG